MIFQKETKEWATSARPWALLSCSFLTLGIALGSWWATMNWVGAVGGFGIQLKIQLLYRGYYQLLSSFTN